MRHTPSSVTGISPAEVLFKHKPKIRLSQLRPQMSTAWRKSADKMISTRPSARLREFKVGEQVLAQGYGASSEKWVRGIVTEKTGPLSYKIKINGCIIR